MSSEAQSKDLRNGVIVALLSGTIAFVIQFCANKANRDSALEIEFFRSMIEINKEIRNCKISVENAHNNRSIGALVASLQDCRDSTETYASTLTLLGLQSSEPISQSLELVSENITEILTSVPDDYLKSKDPEIYRKLLIKAFKFSKLDGPGTLNSIKNALLIRK
jgi:folylpolyglutamate synthase/dihydropteroate synthase